MKQPAKGLSSVRLMLRKRVKGIAPASMQVSEHRISSLKEVSRAGSSSLPRLLQLNCFELRLNSALR